MTKNTYSEKDTSSSINVLISQKKQLEERKKTIRSWRGWTSAVLIGAVATGAIALVIHPKPTGTEAYFSFLTPWLLIGVCIGIMSYGFITWAIKIDLLNELRNIENQLAKLGTIEELNENSEESFFTTLIRINFKYIEQYYLQTQTQAKKSFRLSGFAAIAGLLIITAGIVMMFLQNIQPAYVTTAAGIISEFIASIFFYLYNRTILKMSQYHQKLVMTQNISLALKITDGLQGEQKGRSLELLIERLTKDINKYLNEIKD